MLTERSVRRLPLRDLLADAEKRTRTLLEHFHVTWNDGASELRELSRPVRKRTHFPTLGALRVSLERLLQIGQETVAMIELLTQELEEISLHAQRERQNRM